MIVVGVDVGGTKTDTRLVAYPTDGTAGTGSGNNRGPEILAVDSRPTDIGGSDAVAQTIVDGVDGVLAAAGGVVGRGRLSAVGVGIPGYVDPDAGTVRHAVNLGIDGEPFELGRIVQGRLGGVPVVVDNDVRAAAAGAYAHLRSTTEPDLQSLVYIGIGTGISAGAVLDGRVHRGSHNGAGEIGHVPVMASGPRCRCGMVGCLEAVAAGPAVVQGWPGGAADLYLAVADGEPEATRLAEVFAGSLAQAVMWLAVAYDPDLIVLGGGVGSSNPIAASMVTSALGSLAAGSDPAAHAFATVRIESLDPDVPVGPLGAASLAAESAADKQDPGASTRSNPRGGDKP